MRPLSECGQPPLSRVTRTGKGVPMRKRLTIGLATGLLAAAILPGGASAALDSNYGKCISAGKWEHTPGTGPTTFVITNKGGLKQVGSARPGGNEPFFGYTACD